MFTTKIPSFAALLALAQLLLLHYNNRCSSSQQSGGKTRK